jgi:hypothetical protein
MKRSLRRSCPLWRIPWTPIHSEYRHEAEGSNTGGQTPILRYGSEKSQVRMRVGVMDEPPRCWGRRTGVGRVIWHHYCVNVLEIRVVQIDQVCHEFCFEYVDSLSMFRQEIHHWMEDIEVVCRRKMTWKHLLPTYELKNTGRYLKNCQKTEMTFR